MESDRKPEQGEATDLPPKKKLKTSDSGGDDTTTSTTDNEEGVTITSTPTFAPEFDGRVPGPDSGADTRRCELCQRDRPRSCYGKKQWNKPYGGWSCQECSGQQREKERIEQQELSQQDKQNRHDQKIADQAAKTQDTFSTERRCLTCRTTKPRTGYSGKQWKQLFRECQECVHIRQTACNRGQPPRNKALSSSQQQQPNFNNVVDRLCSSCCQLKHRPEFFPKQWKTPQDADRLCKQCWAEEEEAKEQHRASVESVKTKQDPDVADKKRCFACHEFKCIQQSHQSPSPSFSKKQLSKPYGICIPCIVVLQEERHRQKNTCVCSVCHEEKGWDQFAHEQRKSNKAVRRCRTCAADHVRDREEHRLAEQQQQQQQQQ